ncbi:MAG: PfkB family carbohydrate kinase [marine benthic group bacterium]|nr:PfkB family carbohydrate kinase [Gemmatimonadota bacterium]
MTDYEARLGSTRARSLLDAATGGTVLVVGDAMLDRYLEGSVDRISPEAPVPVVHVANEREALGGAANVAAGVVALGAQCRIVATVGDDRSGEAVRQLLTAHGVSVADLVPDATRPTTEKTRILARHQQILRIDRESAAPVDSEVASALEAKSLAALEAADVLVLEDYDKGVLSPELSGVLLREARRLGIPSVVDPKLRHFFDFQGAWLFKPNVRELAAALGLEQAPRAERDLRPLLDRLGCENLLLTLGEEGMVLLSHDRPGQCRIPSRAREVFDVTGAGDTVIATIATSLIGAAELPEAAALANVAAGIEVGHIGAVPVTREELLEELARRD